MCNGFISLRLWRLENWTQHSVLTSGSSAIAWYQNDTNFLYLIPANPKSQRLHLDYWKIGRWLILSTFFPWHEYQSRIRNEEIITDIHVCAMPHTYNAAQTYTITHVHLEMCYFRISGGIFFIHYNDVIISVMASQITSVSTVCSTVCSGADQRKHQSSASLAFVRGIHR